MKKLLENIVKTIVFEFPDCTKTRCQNKALYLISCVSEYTGSGMIGCCCEEHIDEALKVGYVIEEVYVKETEGG